MATQWPQQTRDFFVTEFLCSSENSSLTKAICLPRTPLRILFRIQWKHWFLWALDKTPMSAVLGNVAGQKGLACIFVLWWASLWTYFHCLGDKIAWDKPSTVFLQHIEQWISTYYHRVVNNSGGDWSRQPTQSILEYSNYSRSDLCFPGLL